MATTAVITKKAPAKPRRKRSDPLPPKPAFDADKNSVTSVLIASPRTLGGWTAMVGTENGDFYSRQAPTLAELLQEVIAEFVS